MLSWAPRIQYDSSILADWMSISRPHCYSYMPTEFKDGLALFTFGSSVNGCLKEAKGARIETSLLSSLPGLPPKREEGALFSTFILSPTVPSFVVFHHLSPLGRFNRLCWKLEVGFVFPAEPTFTQLPFRLY